jgi:hypothetical protein
VNHSADEYVRGAFWYTNSVESYFALLKRGLMGSFHNVSEAHPRTYYDITVTDSEPPRVCRRLFVLSHATIANSSICA